MDHKFCNDCDEFFTILNMHSKKTNFCPYCGSGNIEDDLSPNDEEDEGDED